MNLTCSYVPNLFLSVPMSVPSRSALSFYVVPGFGGVEGLLSPLSVPASNVYRNLWEHRNNRGGSRMFSISSAEGIRGLMEGQ